MRRKEARGRASKDARVLCKCVIPMPCDRCASWGKECVAIMWSMAEAASSSVCHLSSAKNLDRYAVVTLGFCALAAPYPASSRKKEAILEGVRKVGWSYHHRRGLPPFG